MLSSNWWNRFISSNKKNRQSRKGQNFVRKAEAGEVSTGFDFIPVSFLSLYRLSCHCRRRHRLPLRHLPHPPAGLPHEEEGRGQLRPGREETLRRRLPEGPHQGVLRVKTPSLPRPSPPHTTLPPASVTSKQESACRRKWLVPLQPPPHPPPGSNQLAH